MIDKALIDKNKALKDREEMKKMVEFVNK